MNYDWRYLAGVAVIGCGTTASVVHHVVYFSMYSVSTFELLASLIAPLLLVCTALVVGISCRRSTLDDRHLWRVAAWFTAGGLVLGIAGYTSLRYQLPNEPLRVVWLPSINWAFGGMFVGLIIGQYDLSRSRALSRAESNQADANLQARRLSVLNRVLRHDIRNKLTVILAHAEFMKAETDSDSPAAIERAGNDLFEIAERARELQTMFDEATPHATSLSDHVEAAIATLRAEHPAVAISTDLDEEVSVLSYPILGDAIEDLLENAVVHNDNPPDETEVAIELYDLSDERIQLVIEDNGPGIPPLEQVVFGDGGETQLHHSRGTGLWLTRWIIEESDGEFSISETYEGGTRVEIRLRKPA